LSAIVYDAGALIAAEDGVERMWALHQQHRLGLFVQSCDVESFSEQSARAAGVLLSVAPHGVVDASVVACALRRESPCVTGNRAHLVELAGTRGINIIDI